MSEEEGKIRSIDRVSSGKKKIVTQPNINIT